MWNPGPPALGVWSLGHWISREVLKVTLLKCPFFTPSGILRVVYLSPLSCFRMLLSPPVRKWKSCWTLWDPTDYTAHGILQARILEWVAVPFSRASSQPRDWTRSPTLQADSVPSEPPGGSHSFAGMSHLLFSQPAVPVNPLSVYVCLFCTFPIDWVRVHVVSSVWTL